MTNNIGLTFSVGDTIPQFTNSIDQGQLELVTLSIIFSVAVGLAPFIVSNVTNHLLEENKTSVLQIVCIFLPGEG